MTSMNSVVLDTCVSGEFFYQYFSIHYANRGNGLFEPMGHLSQAAVEWINKILRAYRSNDLPPEGKVIVPPLALIELVRKWDEIVQDRFSISSLEAFIDSPPDWVSVSSWDESLIPSFIRIPNEVYVDGRVTPMEWTDCIFPATALSFGEGNAVATSDRKLLALKGQLSAVIFV